MNKKLNRDIILKNLSAHHDQLQSFGVERIGLFGSFLHSSSTVTETSDVDILVSFQAGKKSFKNFMNLLNFLEELFKREIDLVTIESLSPYIGPRIIKEVEYATLG